MDKTEERRIEMKSNGEEKVGKTIIGITSGSIKGRCGAVWCGVEEGEK